MPTISPYGQFSNDLNNILTPLVTGANVVLSQEQLSTVIRDFWIHIYEDEYNNVAKDETLTLQYPNIQINKTANIGPEFMFYNDNPCDTYYPCTDNQNLPYQTNDFYYQSNVIGKFIDIPSNIRATLNMQYFPRDYTMNELMYIATDPQVEGNDVVSQTIATYNQQAQYQQLPQYTQGSPVSDVSFQEIYNQQITTPGVSFIDKLPLNGSYVTYINSNILAGYNRNNVNIIGTNKKYFLSRYGNSWNGDGDNNLEFEFSDAYLTANSMMVYHLQSRKQRPFRSLVIDQQLKGWLFSQNMINWVYGALELENMFTYIKNKILASIQVGQQIVDLNIWLLIKDLLSYIGAPQDITVAVDNIISNYNDPNYVFVYGSGGSGGSANAPGGSGGSANAPGGSGGSANAPGGSGDSPTTTIDETPPDLTVFEEIALWLRKIIYNLS